MKKLVLMFVAAVAISFASCGNPTQSNVHPDGADTIDSVAADTVGADSVTMNSVAE